MLYRLTIAREFKMQCSIAGCLGRRLDAARCEAAPAWLLEDYWKACSDLLQLPTLQISGQKLCRTFERGEAGFEKLSRSYVQKREAGSAQLHQNKKLEFALFTSNCHRQVNPANRYARKKQIATRSLHRTGTGLPPTGPNWRPIGPQPPSWAAALEEATHEAERSGNRQLEQEAGWGSWIWEVL
jgi:hypothetical protein